MMLSELLASSPAFFLSSVFLFSLLIGSFLNVVIHRLPIMMDREWRQQSAEMLTAPSLISASGDSSAAQAQVPIDLRPPPQSPSQPHPPVTYNLITPRSACPHCQAPIKAWQNVPLVSYLLLKGKCAVCKHPISPRYPAIELATAVLSVIVAWQFGFGWQALAALVFTWVLIALSVIDFDHQILPDQMTLSLMWIGLLLSVAAPQQGQSFPVSPASAIIGAVAGYLTLWTVYQLFKLVTGKEGMGYGDFKLLAAFGAWFGWQILPLIILLSAFSGACIGLLLIVLRGHDRNIPIPFGPYLATAGWIALIWGPQLVGSYLHITGLGTY
jgi:leader peptidase (prepilin peptidase)/N-methyltransferase